MDVSSLAKMRVSLLKFEPKVSNFPVLSARVADSTRATAQSLFSLLQKIGSIIYRVDGENPPTLF